MAFLDFLFGKPEQMQQAQLYTPEQQQSMQQQLGGATQQLPQIFEYLNQILSQNPELMKQFEAPAMRQFEEQILPTIAERFSGLNAQKSSAFGQQLGQAGAGLSENIAAQRAGLGQQAIGQLQQLLQGGQQRQYENIFRPQTFGALGQLAGGIGQGLGTAGSLGLKSLLGF